VFAIARRAMNHGMERRHRDTMTKILAEEG
jgi:hypothetical protein